jgi:uncharacterized cupin superfamily protein
MRRFNLHNAEFRYNDKDPDGYKSAVADVAGALGASELATYVYELPPGQALCAYHYEYVEEWLVVLDGSPVVRLPESEEQLEQGDVVAFPPGPEGAHNVINRGSDTARVLMFSSARLPGVAVYPDSDKIAVFTEGGRDDIRTFRERGDVGYWERERL